MSKQTRTLARSLHVSAWWSWLALGPLLAGACKSRDLGCDTTAIFQALNREQDAGAAPFNIDRPGPEVRRHRLHNVPDGMTLRSDNSARLDWTILGHIYRRTDLLYSPAEGVAREVDDPTAVYPMRRFSEAGKELAWFGFWSTACRDPNRGTVACEFGEEKLTLVAVMICHPE